MAIAAHNHRALALHNANKQLQQRRITCCMLEDLFWQSPTWFSVYKASGHMLLVQVVALLFNSIQPYSMGKEEKKILDHFFNQTFHLSKLKSLSILHFLSPSRELRHTITQKRLLRDAEGAVGFLPSVSLTCLFDELDTSGISPGATGQCVCLPTASACFCSIFHQCCFYFFSHQRNKTWDCGVMCTTWISRSILKLKVANI